MVKKISALFLLFSFLLSGCSSQSDLSSGSVADIKQADAENSSLDVSESLSSNTADDNTEFTFSSNINVLYKSDSGNYIPTFGETIEYGENGLELEIVTSASPDISLGWEKIKLDIFVVIDGNIIEHSSSRDTPCTEISSYETDTYKSSAFPIYIPKTDLIQKDNTLLNIVCNYAPDHIANNGIQSFSGVITFPVQLNTSSINNNSKNTIPSADDNDYLDINFKELAFDFGYKYAYKSGYKISTDHMAEDVIIDKDNKELYIKVSLGENIGSDYYVCLLCDGEFIEAFDNKKFIKINTINGTRVLNYKLDADFIPDSGTHAYQVIILPSSDLFGHDSILSFSTYKHRVVIN